MSYADREDWKDVQPIPQDDGPNPLVPIAYGNDCMLFYSVSYSRPHSSFDS